jgi:hypothetical protein
MPAPPDQRPSRPPLPPLRDRPRPPLPGGNRRPPRDAAKERALAFAGVGALLVALVLCIAWITGASGGDDEGAGEQQAAEATPQATATPKPKPTAVPLSADEKAERQVALEVLASRDMEPTRLRDWDPNDTLRVLVGETTDGGKMAFFFVNGDYVGNDTSEVSGSLKVKRTDDLTTTLRYGTFVAGDRPGKPSGEPVDVAFTWDGTALSPETEVPPLDQRRATITTP